MYQVILYYCFADVPDVDGLRAAQHALCTRLNLQGRIYVAEEGINGTCAGSPEDVRAYMDATRVISGFEGIEFKSQQVDEVPFARLTVKVRPYLVNMGEDSLLNPHQEGGEHMSPEEWNRFLSEEDDYVLLDVRNDYEEQVGRFRGAVGAPHSSFSEFNEWADQLDADRDKPVLMYCTGGIRCEKFSGVLKRRGYRKVYQLHGGILAYAEKFGGEHFEGGCFVFDDRMVVDIGGSPNPSATCVHCGDETMQYLNCANMDCHTLVLMCPECALAHGGCCCEDCEQAPRLREFREEHLRRPFRRKHIEHVSTGGAE